MDLKTAERSGMFPKLILELPRIKKIVSIIKEKLGDEFAYAIIIGSSVNTPSKAQGDIDLWIGIKGDKPLKNYELFVKKIVDNIPNDLCVSFTGERPGKCNKIPVEVSVQGRTPKEFGINSKLPTLEPEIFYPYILVDGSQDIYDARILQALESYLFGIGPSVIKDIQSTFIKHIDKNVLEIHKQWWAKIKNAALHSTNLSL